MAAFIYLADATNSDKAASGTPNLLLDSGPEYWFLYRYFEAANLDRRHELVDLYGGGLIEGYQLNRLEAELNQALSDIESRPGTWNVLVGWSSETRSAATEDWRPLEKSVVRATIQAFLDIIHIGSKSGLTLVVSGD